MFRAGWIPGPNVSATAADAIHISHVFHPLHLGIVLRLEERRHVLRGPRNFTHPKTIIGAPSGHNVIVVIWPDGAGLTSHHLAHFHRWKNPFVYPLFHLPEEPILGIFAHARSSSGRADFERIDLFFLSLECHPLLFHSFGRTVPQMVQIQPSDTLRNELQTVPWWELEGGTFNNPRFLLFRGSRHEPS